MPLFVAVPILMVDPHAPWEDAGLFPLLLSLAVAGPLPAGEGCADSGFLQEPAACADGQQVTPEAYDPQEGDLVFSWSGGLVKKAAYCLFHVGPPSHVGIVVRGTDGRLLLLEANFDLFAHLWGVTLLEIYPRLNSYRGPVWVRRLHCPLTPEQSCRLTQFALAQEGKPFALPHMLLPPLALPRNGPILCRLRLFTACLTRKRWFCSGLVTASGVAAGLLNPYVVRPCFTDPRDLFVDRLLDLSPVWGKPIRWSKSCRTCGDGEGWVPFGGCD